MIGFGFRQFNWVGVFGVDNCNWGNWDGFRTFRQKTFRQKHGGGRFGKKKHAETSQAKNFCRNVSYHNVGRMLCMQARPHCRKDKLPLRSLRDLCYR